MRHLILAVGLLAVMVTDVEAQSAPQQPQSPPVVYRYVYPTRPVYRHQQRTVTPRFTRPPNRTGYQDRPYYGAYGYGFYSNGSTDGFPPFQGRRSR